MPVGQPGFDERVVASLLRDIRVLNKAFAEALRQAELRAEHVIPTAHEDTL
ncbi:hypothetical protein OKW46_005682 [Paraburkholderia sp. WSM4179]|nr:hypothetical protein [Paraburkholderia sp. WSM4179]